MLRHFSSDDRELLLSVPYVGPTVIDRLEALGIAELGQLAGEDAQDICRRVAAMLGSSCWANSHQSQKAITGAIATAQDAVADQEQGQQAKLDGRA